MNNQEIFRYLEQCGRLTYSTYYEGEVHSRIAGILTADDDGIYFFALRHKPYARQVLASGQITICGYHEPPAPPHPEYKLRPGFTVRVMGQVREVSPDEVAAKAPNNAAFQKLLDYDYPRYPDTICFCLYKGKGEIFDYDFNCEQRDHKLERTRFAIGGGTFNPSGFILDGSKCVGCGQCAAVCHYDCFVPGEPYTLLGNRCDECGNCFHACPNGAISQPLVF